MAIDLFCYSTRSAEELRISLAGISAAHPQLFSSKFLIRSVRDADELDREIAFEHGLLPRSKFLISLNDKSAAASVKDIPLLLKTALGENQILVLFENEVEM